MPLIMAAEELRLLAVVPDQEQQVAVGGLNVEDSDLNFSLVDYVPCYRSEAGTGNAMCFAYWQ